jgi:hypothetical protein
VINSKNNVPETLDSLKDEIVRLRSEKEKLANELKNREEMMSNLLAYIENSAKTAKK